MTSIMHGFFLYEMHPNSTPHLISITLGLQFTPESGKVNDGPLLKVNVIVIRIFIFLLANMGQSFPYVNTQSINEFCSAIISFIHELYEDAICNKFGMIGRSSFPFTN